jgi:hypothetical protein
VEVGDLIRFAQAALLSGFLGIVPSAYSSDEKRAQGQITKAGPANARRLLVEAAHNYPHRPAVGENLKARQSGQWPLWRLRPSRLPGKQLSSFPQWPLNPRYVFERRRCRLIVDLSDHVDPTLVEELLAVERECCPFLELGWEPKAQRLTVSVSNLEHQPTLDAIVFALGLGGSVRSTASD